MIEQTSVSMVPSPEAVCPMFSCVTVNAFTLTRFNTEKARRLSAPLAAAAHVKQKKQETLVHGDSTITIKLLSGLGSPHWYSKQA